MKKPNMKAPQNTKEYAGYFVYKVVTPIASGILVFAFFKETDLEPMISIPVGLLAWYFWFRPVFVYLFAPVWNSLYIPCPDSPEDSGTATCDVYVSKDSGDKFFQGIAGEFLPFTTDTYIRIDTMLSYLKEKNYKKKLRKVGKVDVEYIFESFKYNVSYSNSPFRKGITIKTKFPVYGYKLKNEEPIK